MTNIQNGGYLCDTADDVKYSNNVKHKNLYPAFMKELQIEWNWSAAMDLRRTDIKQRNKNVNWHFCFDNVNKIHNGNKEENECVWMV